MESQTPEVRTAVWWKYPVGVFAVLAPLAFVWKVDVGMAGYEYELNTWFVGYTGEYVRHHHAFPETFHNAEQVGVAIPVFYGYLLFKIAGLLSLIGGPHLAIRIVIGACFAAVYLTVRATLRRFRATEGLAALGACAVCWATYPLTNLYNRFAFAEFFAASCLTCACCFWATFFLRPRRTTGWLTALTAGFFLTLATGTHPLTGMLGLPFLVLLYLLQWTVPVPERPGLVRRHAALAVSAAASLLVLSPWLYAYKELGKELAITPTFSPGLGYFDGGTVTATLIRLSPIPIDYQNYNPASERLGVAHLDTQMNLPLAAALLVLVAAVARPWPWGRRARFVYAAAPLAALGLLAFAISVYRTGFAPGAEMLYPKFPTFLWKFQFAYRLVAAINLSLLLLLVAALAYRRAVAGSGPAARVGLAPFALGAIAALSATGLAVKLVNGKASVAAHGLPLRNSNPAYEKWLVAHPCGSARDFVTTLEPVLSAEEAVRLTPRPFAIGTGDDFGRPLPLRVAGPADGFVGTQTMSFKWHAFLVDGAAVPADRVRVWNDARPDRPTVFDVRRVAVPVPAGEHTIEYAFAPPRAWSVLNAISPYALACWCVGLVTAWLRHAALRLVRSTGAAPGGRDRPLPVPPPPLARAA
jgi:hypothetical protein